MNSPKLVPSVLFCITIPLILFTVLFLMVQSLTMVRETYNRFENIKEALLEHSLEPVGPRQNRVIDTAQFDHFLKTSETQLVIRAFETVHPQWVKAVNNSEATIYDRLRAMNALLGSINQNNLQATISMIVLLGLVVLGMTSYTLASEYHHRKRLDQSLRKSETAQLLLEAIEAERSHLAYELHDGIAQKLGFIRQQLQDQPQPGPTEEKISTIITSSIEELRVLYLGLKGETIVAHNLCDRLQNLAQEYAIVSNTKIGLSFFGGLEHITEGTNTHQLFRIVQELLSNGLKHSQCTTIDLQLGKVPPFIRISYRDDGKGLSSSMKLDSLEYRCRALQGKLTIHPREKGTQIFVEVPFEKSSDC